MTSIETAPSTDPGKPAEDLKKMSIGDHLDELRRRLIWCLGTLFLSVGVMLPFKEDVTRVYTGPYNLMWGHAYSDFLAENEERFKNTDVGSKDPEQRLAAARELSPNTIKALLAGDHPGANQLAAVNQFGKSYPASTSAEWVGWQREFEPWAKKLRRERNFLESHVWNLEYSESILGGEFEDYDSTELIYKEGGFPLKKSLVAMGGLEDFWTFMAATLLFSCILAAPMLLYHLWAFIAAGLYHAEKKVIHKALPFALILLVAGVSFGYFIMVPYGLLFLTKLMDWAQVTPMFSVANYFKFFLTLTVALGMVFQMPLLMLALQKVGILKRKMILNNWRWVVLSFFLISAMLTPPDPVTQMLMVTPMLTLFLLGLFLMWRADKKAAKVTAIVES